MTKLQSQLNMMRQTMMSAMIAQVHTPGNSHSNESKSTNSESYSVQRTSNYKHNTRSSRNKNECKKVTFENTTPMLLNVTNPANSHFNEYASIKSASYSANHATNTESSKANKYKNTTFENPTTNAGLLTQEPTGNLTMPRPSQLMTQPPKNLADQEKENDHKLVSTGTTHRRRKTEIRESQLPMSNVFSLLM